MRLPLWFQGQSIKWRRVLLWLLFVSWLLLQVPTFLRLAQQGQVPIDYLAYYRAAQSLAQGASPYLSQEQSRQIWRYFHQNEVEVIMAQQTAGQGQEVLQEQAQRPQQPGPYLYPPTLARLINFFHLTPLPFAVLLLLSILGFSWIWLNCTGAHSVWLLLVISSLDVSATLHGGNVELILLWATLFAAWLLWRGHGLLAAPFLALVLLTKPFYVLFFITFIFLQWLSKSQTPLAFLKSSLVAAIGTVALIIIEVWSWGEPLQSETVHFLGQAVDYQWFVLPVNEQTPMSLWNRTPMQALISAGVPATIAQLLTLGLWLLFLVLTLWALYRHRLDFPLAFALAFVLLYWGRPVGWVFAYLEFVVVVPVWFMLNYWQRVALMGAVIALMLSHWAAFVRTALGYGMPLLTLQTAMFPWETWLVLPLSWLLLLFCVQKDTARGYRVRRLQE